MPNPQGTILIVEDNEQLRRLLLALLTQLGFRVLVAEDGFSALASMRAELPDVILSDLYMPGMSGFEFLSVVRRRFPMVRAVAMSSAYSGMDVPPGIAADAYYEKATNISHLLQLVKTLNHVERSPDFQNSSTETPIWITKVGHTLPGEDAVVIACPACMRTFPELVGEISPVHETGCIHCSNPIHYAIVDTLDPTPLTSRVP